MKYSEHINKEEFSVAMPAYIHKDLSHHLLQNEGQEEVAFVLYKPSLGAHRFTALIHQFILPNDNERKVDGNVTIYPEFFRRACKIAMKEKSGLALVHSHLGPGWQGMSIDDIITELSYDQPASTLTDLPFVGLTLATDNTWSARIWEYINEWSERKMASTVRVVGKKLSISYNDALRPRPLFKEIYKRTITVWGEENHASLARLRIGVIGLGSVGSIVAEELARMGIERVTLIDFDEIQEHNLDRLLGATIQDIGQLKALIAQRQFSKAATSTHPQIKSIINGITEQPGYQHALDADVLFSCVDRPWPRYVLNHLAYNHLIPVIDGGIRVKFNPETREFNGADWQAMTVGPERPCLECLGQYASSHVTTEQAGLLEDPSYLEGLPRDHMFKSNENIFPFSTSLASMEVLQLIEMVTSIGKAGGYFGVQRYVYDHGYIRLNNEAKCQKGCLFEQSIATGDTIFPAPTGFDHAADKARKRQSIR